MRWEDELNHRYYLGHEAGMAEGVEKGIEQGIQQGIQQERANTDRERTRADTAENQAQAERTRADAAEAQLAEYIKKFGSLDN